jgi:hypothetical protein
MSALPVPASLYFNDFAFDLQMYSIERDGQIISSLKGMPNNERSEYYVHFYSDSDIKSGDYLVSGSKRLLVKAVEFDTYNGKEELIRAIY